MHFWGKREKGEREKKGRGGRDDEGEGDMGDWGSKPLSPLRGEINRPLLLNII